MKKQSIKSRYHEHAGEERAEHGYHKPKSKKKAFEKFKAKKEYKPKKNKEEKVMKEFKEGKLHSGSKKGPLVKNRKQAIAIALSEARKGGEPVKPKRGKMAKRARMALKRKK